MPSRFTIHRWVAILTLTLFIPTIDAASYRTDVQPLLERYCVKCHGPEKVKAELRVDRLDPDLVKGDDAEHWEEVLNNLNIGDMPPEDEPQPTAAERDIITTWVAKQLRHAAEVKRSTGGRNVLRRLTRYEYNNTLRDLLGIELDYAKDLPPEGAAKEGFVNNSAVLGTSGLHIEYFQRIGANAIRKALVLGDQPEGFELEFSPEAHLLKIEEPDDRDQKKKKKRKKTREPIQLIGMERADGGALLPAVPPNSSTDKKAFQRGSMIRVNSREIPVVGPIRVTVRARAVQPVSETTSHLSIAVGHDAGGAATPYKFLGTLEVASDELRDYTFESRLDEFPLQGGTLKSQFIVIQNVFDHGTAKVTAEPVLFVGSVKIEAGVYETWPPESRTRILVSDDIRHVLGGFMKRAYRRPVSNKEVARMVKLHETLRKGGMEAEDATVETLAAVLASPGFLLLSEPSPTAKRRPLSDWELATRLSYFLWSTMPDERLFNLAEGTGLRDPEVLVEEIERMLADEKADAFFENFSSQWLDLDAIYNVAINPEFFPDFKDETKAEMVAETVAFFTGLVKGNRSALDLIDSKDAMLNAQLARHYGIPGVSGQELRPVSLPAGSQRGGILTHGSVLTLNSSGDDTHPIKRGVWVLERLLGDPPPPPPPAVPTLAEESQDGDRQSLKEKLEAHRQQAACMGCHKKIDPWGVAFENYDGVGKWRDTTEGAEPALPTTTQPKSVNNLEFAKQDVVAAPKLAVPTGAGARVRAAYREVNESLESLQRPHNHLRKLGSDGKPDQLRRFVGYIQQRTPNFEKAVDKLLQETGKDRDQFLGEFRAQNTEVLQSNETIYSISDAIAPKAAQPQKNRRARKNKPRAAPKLRGAVDPKTQLTDGTKIADLNALKAYLLEHKHDQFTETLTRRMLAYALGRYLDFTDTDTVNSIRHKFASNDYRMRSLIHGIVLSEPFRTK